MSDGVELGSGHRQVGTQAGTLRAVDGQGGDWSPMAECLLIFAARAMHLRDLILPALKAGKTVLCDRFTDSTRAYQGYAGGLDLNDIEAIKTLSIGAIEPDLTFVMDIPADIGLSRSTRRLKAGSSSEDRFEQKDIAFHQALRDGFLKIAHANPTRCSVIDANMSAELIADTIWKSIRE